VSVNPASAKSLVSLDWILASGILVPSSSASGFLVLPSGDSLCSMNMKLSVTSGLPYDLVLGRDWIFFCRETLPHASFLLSLGIFRPVLPSSTSHPLPLVHPTAQDLDPLPESSMIGPGGKCSCTSLYSPLTHTKKAGPGDGCGCGEPLVCRCPSTSTSVPFARFCDSNDFFYDYP
ncbi:hypothetical protein B0H14DRAFT_2876932, partial [Mycena olivaceomarginata]